MYPETIQKNIAFSDFHITTGDPYEYYRTELAPVLDHLLSLKTNVPVVITICGDLYDKIYRQGEPAAIVGQTFVINILEIAKSKEDWLVIILKGTRSHDGDQIEGLKVFESMYPLKVFTNVGYVEHHGITYRAIPELSWNSYDEFKEMAFKRSADVTLMHGLVEGVHPMILENYKSHNRKKEVVARIDDLQEHTKLYTTCGHIHERHFVADNIWYVSAFSASSMKDANSHQRGYDIIDIREDGTYTVDYILNKNSRRFHKIDITQLLQRKTFNEMKSFLLMKIKEKGMKDFVRMDATASKLNTEEKHLFSTLKSQFSGHFMFELKDGVGVTSDDEMQNIDEEGLYVLDSNIPTSEKIYREILLSEVDGQLKERLSEERINMLVESDVDSIIASEMVRLSRKNK